MKTAMHYCDMPLARNSSLRQDSEWLNGQLAADNGLVYTMWNQQHLVFTDAAEFRATRIPIGHAGLILGNAKDVFYLGHEDQSPVFAADLGNLDQKRAQEIVDHAVSNASFHELRIVTNLMDPQQVSILAFAMHSVTGIRTIVTVVDVVMQRPVNVVDIC